MKLLCAVAVLFCSLFCVFAQTQADYELWENGVGKSRWFTYHLKKDDVLLMKTKWDKIEKSLESTTNSFAGKYFQYGFMSGYFLNWSPEAGFIYVQYFDVEHPCYFSYGKVAVKDFEINFITEYETSEPFCPGSASTPQIWIPANGGKYLIPKKESKRFGNFYGGFGEFNGFFRKWTEEFPFASKWKKDFQFKQNFILPKNFEADIKKPINAEVIAVGKKKVVKFEPHFSPFYENSSITPATINVGTKNGVTKGLEFILLNLEGEDSQTLKITKVGKNTSQGIVIRRIDDKGFEGYFKYDEKSKDMIDTPFPSIQVGQKVSTSPFHILDF
ncbi:MAG TPA: hypothetical protein VNI84_04690 [Pyrinomonadaceae bacterium]|nr:hypothetical protein [Pyrinomonadaceae bacterium]